MTTIAEAKASDFVESVMDFSLQDLANIHYSDASRHELELRGAFGDGYLLNQSSLLTNLRHAVKCLHYKIEPRIAMRGINNAFPLLELIEILTRRRIPYYGTESAIEQYLERDPDVRIDKTTYKRRHNHINANHEMAHALFFEVAVSRFPMTPQNLVDCLLASEAFSLAFERTLAIQHNNKQGSCDSLFLASNSYVKCAVLSNDPDSREATAELIDISEKHTGALLSFLACGYYMALSRPTRKPSGAGIGQWIAQYCGMPACRTEGLNALVDLAFKLDIDFNGALQDDFYSFLHLTRELHVARTRPLNDSFATGSLVDTVLPIAVRAIVNGELSLAPFDNEHQRAVDPKRNFFAI